MLDRVRHCLPFFIEQDIANEQKNFKFQKWDIIYFKKCRHIW